MRNNMRSCVRTSVFIFTFAFVTLNAIVTHAAQWEDEANERIRLHRMGDVTVRVVDSSGVPVSGAHIKLEQQGHDFWFGTALAYKMFKDGVEPETRENYQRIVQEYFNSAVHENALKWYHTEPQKGKINYEDADRVLEWCEAHGIRMRGHTVFWAVDKYVMSWIKELDNHELLRAVERRATDMPARYASRIFEYDVNNEMIHGRYFRDRLGDSIVNDMFNWIRQSDPDAVLYVNDYDVLSGLELDHYIEHIKSLQESGVPVGGIGLQGHFDRIQMIPKPSILLKRLDRLAELGLPIKITEFDFDTTNEKQKAKKLVEFYRTCFSHPAVEGIVMWGFWEGAHWKPNAALFNKDFTPRPAALAYHELVFKKWWSNVEGTTGETGEFTTRVFYGRYRVQAVMPSGEKVSRQIDFPRGTIQPEIVLINMD